jgi:ubiquinone biosynthesis protein UbiJ
MPFAQLITSAIEVGINQLLQLDPDSQIRLKKLAGKTLQVKVTELPWPVLFSFSQQIDVQTVIPLLQDEPAASPADCLIELDFEILPKLQDSSQLTRLIQQKKLNLVGDIYVAQTFSSLIKELDIDWEEQLSKYTGDVMAHQTFTTMRSVFDSAKNNLEQAANDLGVMLTQPNSVAVTTSDINQFSENVSELRSAAERLSARLLLLEQNKTTDTGSDN